MDGGAADGAGQGGRGGRDPGSGAAGSRPDLFQCVPCVIWKEMRDEIQVSVFHLRDERRS